MFPHALAKCEAGQCKIDVCDTDYGNYDASSPGCELCPVRPVRDVIYSMVEECIEATERLTKLNSG